MAIERTIFSLNLNYSDFITLNCDIAGALCTFLVDTQADVSIIKNKSLLTNTYYNSSEIIKIKGVTDGSIASIGTVYAKLYIHNYTVSHKLHIVPETFNIPSDGILGKDFLRTFQCKIDYQDMSLALRLNNSTVTIPIVEGPQVGTTVIPARSEVIRSFQLQNFRSPQIIDSQEITPGVFIARTVAHSPNPLVRVVNTTSETKIISNLIGRTEDLSQFHVYHMTQSCNTGRTNELIEILAKRTPLHAQEGLIPLCKEYSDVFALDSDQMTVNNFYEQKLRVGDTDPVYVKNYRLPKSQKSEIDSQVNKLLKNNLIEPSRSNYNSPLILVPKKSTDGTKKWRMCVDYRLVNKKLIADKFPLPRIDDILDGLGRAKYFSVLDLYSGFHQIKIHEDSRDITSFSTDKGSYRWKVLPFGLNVSPNSFARMMTMAFAGLPPEQAFLYMDDIIVIGCSEQHHLNNIRKIFEVCRKYNLKLNPQKCEFFRPEVIFLGHRCTAKGLLPDESKISAIRNYQRPDDKDATRRLVAFANYYRRFIRDFADIVQPLNRLTRKTVEFEWTEDCESAFRILIDKLSSPPILQYPDFSKQFLVTVDASGKACGAVLSQNFDGDDLPIYFASKSFNKGELNKSTIEKELLAIHFAINHFRPYIYGTHFTVRSDHKPLIYLFSLKNPSSKLTRIRLELEEYSFTIEHIKGKDNVAADALSRITIEDLKNMYEKTVSALPMTTRSMAKRSNVQSNVRPERQIREHELSVIEELNGSFEKSLPRVKCMHLESLMNHNSKVIRSRLCAYEGHKKIMSVDLHDTVVNEKLSLEIILSKLQKEANNQEINKIQWPLTDEIFLYCTVNEFKSACQKILNNLQIILITRPTTITNDSEKFELMTRFHDNPIFGGHSGQKKLYAKLRSNYYWKGMTRDIAKFVKNCNKCQVNKVRPGSKEPLVLTPTPQRPFDIVVVDTIGPLQKSYQGNSYAVTMVCDLTKYLVVSPIPNKEAKTVARAIFNDFILVYGPMRQMTTDMGTEYKNEVIAELCELLKVNHCVSTAYRHQTVGTVERNHRYFNEFIRAYISENLDHWEEYIKYFAFCYNISYSSSLDHKFTPYELVFNKHPGLPCQLLDNGVDPIYNVENFAKEAKYRLQKAHEQAKRLIEKAKMRNKEFFDRTSRPLNINVNDKILVEKEPYNKFKQIYSGPFIVKSIAEPNVLILDPLTNKTKLIHKNRLRKFNNN